MTEQLIKEVKYIQQCLINKEMTGDVIARATGDVEQITRVIAGPLNGFIGRIMTFVFLNKKTGKLPQNYGACPSL